MGLRTCRRGRCVLYPYPQRVGSIGDNRLRWMVQLSNSKAAQNMLIKTAAHEIKRRNPDAVIAALHPGTVDTSLFKSIHETAQEWSSVIEPN